MDLFVFISLNQLPFIKQRLAHPWIQICDGGFEEETSQVAERIVPSFQPIYEGSGLRVNPHLEVAKLGIDFDGVLADEVGIVNLNCLKNPPQLLQAFTMHKLKITLSNEIEKIDVRSDA